MKIFTNFRPENDPDYDGIKEICKNKPITFFYDYIPQSLDQLKINPFNFIWLVEPNEFFGMHTWVMNNYHLFTGILTWNEDILNQCPNAVCFPYNADGGAFREVTNEGFDAFVKTKEKNIKFEVSFLSGAKSLVSGHQLRQEIYKIGNQINIPKKWFYTLEDFNQDDFAKGGVGRPDKIWGAKQKCYTESMFHIGVENVNYKNWYTEKIADSFATKTIPIYNGCPNLEELGYDERGIIRFNTIPELISILNSLTPDLYEKMLPYMEHNYNEVLTKRTYIYLEAFFQELIGINNL